MGLRGCLLLLLPAAFAASSSDLAVGSTGSVSVGLEVYGLQNTGVATQAALLQGSLAVANGAGWSTAWQSAGASAKQSLQVSVKINSFAAAAFPLLLATPAATFTSTPGAATCLLGAVAQATGIPPLSLDLRPANASSSGAVVPVLAYAANSTQEGVYQTKLGLLGLAAPAATVAATVTSCGVFTSGLLLASPPSAHLGITVIILLPGGPGSPPPSVLMAALNGSEIFSRAFVRQGLAGSSTVIRSPANFTLAATAAAPAGPAPSAVAPRGHGRTVANRVAVLVGIAFLLFALSLRLALKRLDDAAAYVSMDLAAESRREQGRL